MTWIGASAMLLAAFLVTGAAAHLVFRCIGVELRRRHAEVGTAIFLQLGVIYAVFLAFVFGQALTGFVAADDSIDAECAALHGASIMAEALPAENRSRIDTAIRRYVEAVLHAEWPAMRATRTASPEATEREREIFMLANGLDFNDAHRTAVQERVLAQMTTAHTERERRIFEAGQGIPLGLWIMILAYCGALVGLVLFASLEYVWSHTILAGAFGGLNALVLLAVWLLQYPFEGPLRLSSDSFSALLTKLPGP